MNGSIRVLSALMLVAALAGCQGTSRGAISQLTWRPIYVDVERKQLPSAFRFALRPVPGELYGVPDGDYVYLGLVEPSQTQSLSMVFTPTILERLKAAAQPLVGGEYSHGLTMTPADARIARLGTFVLRTAPRAPSEIPLAANPQDPEAPDDAIFLVYVDRACRIQGRLDAGPDGGMGGHDLRFPGPGVHWVRARKRAQPGVGSGFSWQSAYERRPIEPVTLRVTADRVP